MDPSNTAQFGRDATFEEILHNINGMGHAQAYPEAFDIFSRVIPDPGFFGSGSDPGPLSQSKPLLAQAMDVARGGYFENVPGKLNIYFN